MGTLVDDLNTAAILERKRGDTYRRRALVCFRRGRSRAQYLTEIYHQAEDDFTSVGAQLVAERARAERYRALLARWSNWYLDDTFQHESPMISLVKDTRAALAAGNGAGKGETG